MKKFDLKHSLEAFKALKNEEYIVFKVDEKISDELEELAYRKSSIEELFRSSLDSEAPMERVYEIIKQYTAINILLEKSMCAILKNTLDEKAFIYLRDPMTDVNYYFNFTLKSIVISKKLT